MICPQCGEPQLAGSRRCPACGGRVYAPGAVAYSRRGSGGRVFAFWAGLLVVAAIALLALPGLVMSPLHHLADRAEDWLGPSSSSPSTSTSGTSPVVAPAAKLPSSQVSQVVDTSAGVPTGPHVTITQAEMNQFVAQHASDIKPLDHATVTVAQDGVEVDFGAYGMSGHYHGRVAVVDGVPIVTGGKIDGVLGWFVSPSQLESALNSEIEDAVAQQHVVVDRVVAQPGELIFYTQD